VFPGRRCAGERSAARPGIVEPEHPGPPPGEHGGEHPVSAAAVEDEFSTQAARFAPSLGEFKGVGVLGADERISPQGVGGVERPVVAALLLVAQERLLAL
jgi:hypothetical protein